MHRVSPWRPPAACSDEPLSALFPTARDLLVANASGSAPRCGTLVGCAPLGEQARLAYWCPTCEPD